MNLPGFMTTARPLTPVFLTHLRSRFSFMNLWNPETGNGNFFGLGQTVFFRGQLVDVQRRLSSSWSLNSFLYTDGAATLAELSVPSKQAVDLSKYIPAGTKFVVCHWRRDQGGVQNLYTLHGSALVSYPVEPPENQEEAANMIADLVGMAE